MVRIHTLRRLFHNTHLINNAKKKEANSTIITCKQPYRRLTRHMMKKEKSLNNGQDIQLCNAILIRFQKATFFNPYGHVCFPPANHRNRKFHGSRGKGRISDFHRRGYLCKMRMPKDFKTTEITKRFASKHTLHGYL